MSDKIRIRRLRAALREIMQTRPMTVLNAKAKVGDPHAVGFNVHMIAREALERDRA